MNSILILTYWSFKDALIQSYTLPYVKIITKVSRKKVYLVCLEQAQVKTSNEERLQINRDLEKDNIEVVFFEYNRFGFKQMLLWVFNLIKLIYLVISRKVAYIHAWCTPGGAIGYILSMLTGKPLILDSYEPHAELMAETNTWSRDGIAFKMLFRLEKLQTKRADKIIGVVGKMREYSADKYHYNINEHDFFVKPACVDLSTFYPRAKCKEITNELQTESKMVGLYAGKFGGIYLEDEFFDFVRQCYIHWGQNFVMLLLSGAPTSYINTQLQRAGIPPQVVVQKFVTHKEVPDYMAMADFAVNFMKPVPSRRFSTPIKNGEYWAMGLPVIITANISDDSDIIESKNAGYVLNDLTVDEYKHAVEKIDALLQENAEERKKRIAALAYKYRNFDIAEDVYKQIYG